MDPSTAQHQEMANPSSSFENMLACSSSISQQQDKKPRPLPEQALHCPRCDSTNTKFCYYNNYSLSQPRYFCKSCRRYWTKGGTLRNVPVGGGCRKNKRSSSLSSASSKRTHDLVQQPLTPNSNPLPGLPALLYDSSDLTLALARLQKQTCWQSGYDNDHHSLSGNPSSNCDIIGGNSMPTPSCAVGFTDTLRNGFLETSQNNSLYYGFGEVDNGNGVVSGEVMMPNYDQQEPSNATTQAVTETTVKQELCNAREQSDNRILRGFPWQFNGEGDIGGDIIDQGRGSWNNFSSSWHGLLNSTPLM